MWVMIFNIAVFLVGFTIWQCVKFFTVGPVNTIETNSVASKNRVRRGAGRTALMVPKSSPATAGVTATRRGGPSSRCSCRSSLEKTPGIRHSSLLELEKNAFSVAAAPIVLTGPSFLYRSRPARPLAGEESRIHRLDPAQPSLFAGCHLKRFLDNSDRRRG